MKVVDNEVLVSYNELKRIRNLLSNYEANIYLIQMWLDDHKEEYKLKTNFFISVIKPIEEEIKKLSDSYIVTFEPCFKQDLKIKDNVLKLKETSLISLFEEERLDEINNKLELLEITKKLVKERFCLQEYQMVKEEIITNLKYLVISEDIKKFSVIYDEYIKDCDVKALDTLMEKVRSLIVNDWKKQITNLDDYQLGMPYNLICHSVYREHFEYNNGHFIGKYVSCSLLTDEVHDTYRRGFGFILAPDDMIGASGEDMYINNSAFNDAECFSYHSSYFNPIEPFVRVKEAITERKKVNKKENNIRAVYSEVVIKGFKPIGIFCLTNGALKYDSNYVGANNLAKQFSDLKVYYMDITQNKSEKEQIENIRKDIIRNIKDNPNEYINPYQYDLFWNKLQQLRHQENYTEDDILKIFYENERLINSSVDYNKLFDGEYTDDEIRYILNYNYKSYIKSIYDKNYNFATLNNIYENLVQYKYNKDLERIMPSLSQFLKLYPNILFDDDIRFKICQFDSLENINEFLIEVLTSDKHQNQHYEQNTIIDETFSEQPNLTNIMSLYKKLQKLEERKQLDEQNKDLKLFMLLMEKITLNNQILLKVNQIQNFSFVEINAILLERLTEQKESEQEKTQIYINRLKGLIESKKAKEQKLDLYIKAMECVDLKVYYELTKKEIKSVENLINDIVDTSGRDKSKLEELGKNRDNFYLEQRKLNYHKLINYFKLKRIKQKLIKLDREYSILNTKMSLDVTSLKSLFIDISNYKKHFYDESGFNYDLYENEFKQAEEIIANTDVSHLKFEIEQANNLIHKIESLLAKSKHKQAEYIELEEKKKK